MVNNAAMTFPLGRNADLSPQNWPSEERSHAEQSEMTPWPKEARSIEGKSGLVAATLSPIAVLSGVEALRHGGSASDAAATVALTQIATALGSYVSYAGTLQLLYYEARSGKVYSLNAGWNSYLGESEPRTIPVNDMGPLPFAVGATEGPEGRKTLVPGFMAGLEAMHQRFGELPFQALLQPAIYYAENGVTISPMLASYFPNRGRYLSRTPDGQAFLNQAGGLSPKPGDVFIQKDLAETLRAVAELGSSYMYTGEWGQQFVTAVKREGGKASLQDMQRYQPTWEEPLNTSFLENTVFAPGTTSHGGYRLLEALNAAEVMHLDRIGPYYEDPHAFRILSRILRVTNYDLQPFTQLAQWKRQRGLSLLPEDRLTKMHAKALASALSEIPGQQQARDTNHSDSIVVVDRFGNVAALVHTINTLPWGTTGIVVGGIPLSDAAGFQQSQLAAIAPGDRLPTGMSPSIVTRDGKPILAIATVGSSLFPETARLLVGTLANHLDLHTAMSAPPLLLSWEPGTPGEQFLDRAVAVPEGAYTPQFLEQLRASGITVAQKSKREVFRGTAVLATLDPEQDIARSVETPGICGFVGTP